MTSGRRARSLIYIAGPLTKGDVAGNIRAAMDMATSITLKRSDVFPYIPHLSHFWDLVHHKPYEWWLEYEKIFIDKSNGLIRLPGISVGADFEVKYARQRLKPVLILGKNNESVDEWLERVCGSRVIVSEKPQS